MKPTEHSKSAQCIYRNKRAKACTKGIVILSLSSNAGCGAGRGRKCRSQRAIASRKGKRSQYA